MTPTFKEATMTKLTRTLSSLALLGLVLAMSACNTIEGAGQDVKAAGSEIEEAADDAKN